MKADDPEQFEAYRTAFDNSRFRKEQPAVYDAHMRVTTHREFEWINGADDGTDERASDGHQPQRQSVTRRFFGTLTSTVAARARR